MSKSTQWSEVQAILTQHKAKGALVEALEAILAPKQGGGSSNPPKEIDGVMHYYCRFHQAYEAEEKMVMSGGKSKGYCKASISVWNKRNSALKRKEAEISELVMAGDFVQAKECSEELQVMKAELNDPKSYNLENDWIAFTKVSE
jgi:hypothetical protein